MTFSLEVLALLLFGDWGPDAVAPWARSAHPQCRCQEGMGDAPLLTVFSPLPRGTQWVFFEGKCRRNCHPLLKIYSHELSSLKDAHDLHGFLSQQVTSILFGSGRSNGSSPLISWLFTFKCRSGTDVLPLDCPVFLVYSREGEKIPASPIRGSS